MRMDLHIMLKTVMGVFLWMGLMAGLTMLATAASAQDFATAPASAPSPISAGSASNSGASGTPTPMIGSGNPNQVPPNPSLLAVPVVGTAPLTVDFYVGLANTPPLLFYEWNFGDGAESYLPAEPYMLHVYQNPGTYMCELELVTPQGISIIAFTKITVKPRQDQDSVHGAAGQPESSPRAS
jgi:PKD repeat protein